MDDPRQILISIVQTWPVERTHIEMSYLYTTSFANNHIGVVGKIMHRMFRTSDTSILSTKHETNMGQ